MSHWDTSRPHLQLYAILKRPENRPNYLIAQRAGISKSRLSEYALGRVKIPTKHLISLCTVLQCSPEELESPLVYQLDS